MFSKSLADLLNRRVIKSATWDLSPASDGSKLSVTVWLSPTTSEANFKLVYEDPTATPVRKRKFGV